MLEVTNIKIKKIFPKDGLVGFCSFILDDSLFIGNVGIFTKLNKDSYRLIFPSKKIKDKDISIIHPVNQEFYFKLESLINEKLKDEKEQL